MIKLFVGLGNPVELLKDTRHNTGYMVIDKILDTVLYDKEEGLDGVYMIDVSPDRWVMKPQCSINSSYIEIQKAMKLLNIKADEVCVVYDEMGVLLSHVSSMVTTPYIGTHRAVMAIQENIGDVMTCRIGVGECPKDITKFNFVLGNFSLSERAIIDKMIKRTVEELLSLN